MAENRDILTNEVLDKLNELILTWGKDTTKKMQNILAQYNKIKTGRLAKSLNPVIIDELGAMRLMLNMVYYGIYVEKGIAGYGKAKSGPVPFTAPFYDLKILEKAILQELGQDVLTALKTDMKDFFPSNKTTK